MNRGIINQQQVIIGKWQCLQDQQALCPYFIKC